jgi:hypothetical protein
MLPTQLLSVLHKPGAYAFVVPAFCQNAKDGAPHCVSDTSEIKSLARPPSVGSSVS